MKKLYLDFLIILLIISSATFGERKKIERMAAWHETLIQVNENNASSFVMTYGGKHPFSHNYLTKFIVYTKQNGQLLGPSDITDLKVNDYPGGVAADYSLGNVKVNLNIFPAFAGRNTPQKDGAAFLEVKTEPRALLIIKIAGGKQIRTIIPQDKNPVVNTVNFKYTDAKLTQEDNTLIFKCSDFPELTAVKSHTDAILRKTKNVAELEFKNGHAVLAIGFSPDKNSAKKLASLDFNKQKQKVHKYYDELLSNKIKTPVTEFDNAFKAALYNLEYNWLKPYGWIECIHHWTAVWHQQHTGAANWIGQHDRVEECLLSQANVQLEEGHIPNIFPDGSSFYSWGGSSQFFFWEINNYLKHTADKDFASEIAPVLDKALKATIKREDPQKNSLFSWGLQVGNQEDFIATPYDGTTPTIEVMNMIKTRALIAKILNNKNTAEKWQKRYRQIHSELIQELWLKDLGRFAYYKDPEERIYPEGQYHTYIYPAIYGIVDELDKYTTIRHFKDRLVSKEGLAFCSNNFTNHVGGTWGMQAGTAQQPWAAWGFAELGMNNYTVKPLVAVSKRIMNENLRGSWPEILEEPTPAYFSPPAGLFVQSTIEAVFGLKVNMLTDTLTIAPSIPDLWPKASLNLKNYKLKYTRDKNEYTINVFTKEKLDYILDIKINPCLVKKVLANGKELEYEVTSKTDFIEVKSEPIEDTGSVNFEIYTESVDYDFIYPGSIAEGQKFFLEVKDAEIIKVEDRSGIFSKINFNTNFLEANIRKGLLDNYNQFGKLGQANFSRRTFFIYCKTDEGAEFWKPVNLTLLPEYKASADPAIRFVNKKINIPVLVRNNTGKKLTGKATLYAVENSFDFNVDIPARTQKRYNVTVPPELTALFKPGDNSAKLLLPSGTSLDLTLTLDEIFNNKVLKEFAQSCYEQIDISSMKMVEDTYWQNIKKIFGAPHIFIAWKDNLNILKAIEDKKELLVKKIPGLKFKLNANKFIPVSKRNSEPFVRVDLNSRKCRKIYVLLLPFTDNTVIYSKYGIIKVMKDGKVVCAKNLYYPRDLDYISPNQDDPAQGSFREPRANRYELLPLLGKNESDWSIAKPPAFPQTRYWSKSIPVLTDSCLMNVIELDMQGTYEVDELIIETPGLNSALGIVGVTVYGCGDVSKLKDTEFSLPPEYAGEKIVFNFIESEDIKNWEISGNAFSISSIPHLFNNKTLNSLGKTGEQATGVAVSPTFKIIEPYSFLKVQCQGGRNENKFDRKLEIQLVDAHNGKILLSFSPDVNHNLHEKKFNIKKFRNKEVKIKLVDNNTADSYAWIGIDKVSLTVK